ncbi:hypothetical protein LTR84_012270 [Exophiala bonariae]|uniref:Low temperature requirement A n=1 Tax=Exophiala bonariae TaxID=1690606 RepID=A0AAV9NI68_9EURO|nr:hypothetical protein LTR84_012270 [Exophiala bonariae]
MELGRYLTVRRRQVTQKHHGEHSHENHLERKRLPLIESPVNDQLYDVLDSDGTPNLEKLRSRASVLPAISSTDGPILYKTRHEASTIELFYDLFFVANLATFTAAHNHSDAESVAAYLGFFTLLWFTWLNTTLYDVRFATDSIIERAFKFVHFGVMTAFVFCGPIFDLYDDKSDARTYKKFAVTMAISHAVTTMQYLIVLIQSRRYRTAVLPVALTTLVNALAAIGFGVTATMLPIDDIAWHSLVIWYTLKVLSGVLTVLISVFFRVISFKHAHLTERLSLLTLIVTGEGIIGLSKSLSTITKANKSTSANDIGSVIAAVLLLYLIWMLYFDQLDEEGKMGTIRQQIWALLHFPLHSAIVLMVEGNTSLIPWSSAVQGLNLVWSVRPGPEDAPSTSFANNSAFVTYLNDSMWKISDHFKSYKLAEEYDWTLNLTSIINIADDTTFNGGVYTSEIAPIVDEMFDYAENFVFKAHDASMSKMIKVSTTKASSSAAHDSLASMYEIYDVVTLYFYIGAGTTLLLLSAMYWFGKPHHTRSEAGGPIVRVIVGSLLIGSGCLGVFVDTGTTGYKFQQSTLLIPVVAIAYLVVIIIDTVFTFFSEHPDTGAIIFHRGSRPKRRDHQSMGPSPGADPDSDRARMIPLDSMSGSTANLPDYDDDSPHDQRYSNKPSPMLAAEASELKVRDFAQPEPTSISTLSSPFLSPANQDSRISRFKSLKAPAAYTSLSDDDYDDYDRRQMDRYDRPQRPL